MKKDYLDISKELEDELNALLDEEAESLIKAKSDAKGARVGRLTRTRKAKAYERGVPGKTGVHVSACDRTVLFREDPDKYRALSDSGKLCSPLEVNRKYRAKRLYDGDEIDCTPKYCRKRREERKKAKDTIDDIADALDDSVDDSDDIDETDDSLDDFEE